MALGYQGTLNAVQHHKKSPQNNSDARQTKGALSPTSTGASRTVSPKRHMAGGVFLLGFIVKLTRAKKAVINLSRPAQIQSLQTNTIIHITY